MVKHAAPKGSAVKREHHPAYIVYQHVRELIGAFVTKGWRHAFPWGMIFVILLAYLKEVMVGGVDLKPFYDLAWLVVLAFAWRGGIDKGGLAALADTVIQRRMGGASASGVVG